MWSTSLAWLKDRSRWAILIAAVALLGAAWTAVSSASPQETAQGRIPGPRQGFLAPDFELELLGGGSFVLSEMRGSPLTLNLWASWCPPCRREMPALDAVYAEYQDQHLQVVGVNMTAQDSERAAIEFVRAMGLRFPIALDREGRVARLYQMRALPTTFFIDTQGVVQRVIVGGPMSELTLRSEIEALLAAVD